ncbi:MAG TPA: hypothetical protein VM142_13180 [Acidimicrobiales bacterium]|nr:hypothetical protein [Acidimicrobiales bacterium]
MGITAVPTRIVVVGIVALLGVGVAGVATLRGDEDVLVATVRQAPEPTVPTVPEAPVTMEGVAARLDCPDPPDPNGPAPNPPMPGNLVSVTGDYAAGAGDPTPRAALTAYLRAAWPGADPESFVVTARNSSEVRFENQHAALLATFAEGGVWNVTNEMYCRPMAAEWRAGRR